MPIKQMSDYEVLSYFGLVDEDETPEDLEGFEQLELEAEDGRKVILTMDDLRKAADDHLTLADLMITD